MSEPITLQFRYTKQDYVRAMRLYQSERMRLVRDLPIALGMVALCVYVLLRGGSSWLGGAGLAIALMFAVLLLYAHFVMPLVVFLHEPKLREQYFLQFAAEGIEFRTASVNSRLAWTLYDSVRSDAHTHLLCHRGGGFSALPRRVFASPAQEEAFLTLARSALRRG